MSQAQIIDGKVTAERLRAEVAEEVAALVGGGLAGGGAAARLAGADAVDLQGRAVQCAVLRTAGLSRSRGSDAGHGSDPGRTRSARTR